MTSVPPPPPSSSPSDPFGQGPVPSTGATPADPVTPAPYPPVDGPAGPPKKGLSTGMKLAIGCGALLLLGGVGAFVAYYVFSEAYDKVAHEAAKAAEAARAAGAGGSGAVGSTPSEGAATGSGTCAQAVICCKAIVAKSGGDATAAAACDNLMKLPEASCGQPLDTYKKSATLLNVKCD